MAPGTALVQKRHGGDGITIVIGGDAGTAEGDFASCLIWSTRPGNELPVLMIVTNNGWGISTPACTPARRAARSSTAARRSASPARWWTATTRSPAGTPSRRAMDYCRRERRPYMLEAMVSRLHGHSSSSGAARVKDEPDCIDAVRAEAARGRACSTPDDVEQIHDEAQAEVEAARGAGAARAEADRRRTWRSTPTRPARWTRCIRGTTPGCRSKRIRRPACRKPKPPPRPAEPIVRRTPSLVIVEPACPPPSHWGRPAR